MAAKKKGKEERTKSAHVHTQFGGEKLAAALLVSGLTPVDAMFIVVSHNRDGLDVTASWFSILMLLFTMTALFVGYWFVHRATGP